MNAELKNIKIYSPVCLDNSFFVCIRYDYAEKFFIHLDRNTCFISKFIFSFENF